MDTYRVLIAGGGIGGLTLAHGLRKAGVDVTVFERTLERTDWLQGYRIHINPAGSRALRDCLPERNWHRFVTTVSDPGDGFAFLTPGLEPLLVLPRDLVDGGAPDPADQHHGVSRISLRTVLLDGLDDVVEHGRDFERYELMADGRVTAHFTDGGSATGDLLVGADGANSRVRGQLLPHADRIDTGVAAIAGRYPLTPENRARAPEFTVRANTVLPARRGSFFSAVWSPDALSGDQDGYTLWAYTDAAERMPAEGADGVELLEFARARVADWHPRFRTLVSGSDPASVNLVRFRSAPTRVEPWRPGPVTLIGDAIHSMTPAGGIGANTALRDADLLRRKLIEVAEGRLGPHEAVGEYEARMREYGFAAVRLSLRNARQSASSNPLSRRAFRTVLRAANAVPALKRRMFADLGNSPD